MLQNLFRSYFARFMYPLAQAFVLNPLLRGMLLCLPFWIYDTALTFYVKNNSFFWDTIQLASEHGHFFFEQGFSSLLLPDEMDSGHPPFFGMYVAFCWKILGKTLAVSHLSMLPFLWGITWQSMRLGEKILGEWQAFFLILILKINPISAGQSVLVTPDTPLLFFFLMALNSILNTHKSRFNTVLLSLAVLGLSMISMRGMMVGVALFLFQVYKVWESKELSLKKGVLTMLPYSLGGLCALSFLIYHFEAKGWVGYYAGSRWAPAFERVDIQGFIKNTVVLAWRLVDAGHLILWGVIAYAVVYFYKNKSWRSFKMTPQYGVLLGLLLVVLSPALLLHQGLLQHRYLLPVYCVINVLSLKLVSDMKAGTIPNILYSLIFVGLFSGHFWIYPQPIATSWDTTLAHLPYYRLRSEMLDFIEKEKIPLEAIGTAYPNSNTFKYTDLKNSTAQLDSLNFDKNRYVFYSNVMNDFNQPELEELKKNWKILKILRGGQVEVILYEKIYK